MTAGNNHFGVPDAFLHLFIRAVGEAHVKSRRKK
jgi:hypothetical protein